MAMRLVSIEGKVYLDGKEKVMEIAVRFCHYWALFVSGTLNCSRPTPYNYGKMLRLDSTLIYNIFVTSIDMIYFM